MKLTPKSMLPGSFLVVTCLMVVWTWPFPESHAWVGMLLAWGMVLWVPLASWLSDRNLSLALWMSATGILAFLIGNTDLPGKALATLPYLLVLSYKAYHTWIVACRKLTSDTIASIYLWVGGFHLVAWSMGGLGLPFSPDIILLTALHFHFAGYLLPRAFQHWAVHLPALRHQLWIHLALMAVTALGILWTRLSGHSALESIAGLMTSGNIILAVTRYTLRGTPHWTGIALWVVLLASMSLASAYAIRPWYTLELLTIPFMRATHGTLNALLFPVLVLFPLLPYPPTVSQPPGNAHG